MKSKRYWLRIPDCAWQEVSQVKYIEIERNAGFHPKLNCGPTATGSFSTGCVEGRITYEEPPGD